MVTYIIFSKHFSPGFFHIRDRRVNLSLSTFLQYYASSICTPMSIVTFCLTSLHLSFGLPLFRRPLIYIFHAAVSTSPSVFPHAICISIHTKMFCIMRLTHARHLTRFNYILGDTSLQETDNHPYLGVHITKDLTWNKHIHQITATANRTLAFVRRNLYSCPQHI